MWLREFGLGVGALPLSWALGLRRWIMANPLWIEHDSDAPLKLEWLSGN